MPRAAAGFAVTREDPSGTTTCREIRKSGGGRAWFGGDAAGRCAPERMTDSFTRKRRSASTVSLNVGLHNSHSLHDAQDNAYPPSPPSS